MYKLLKLLGKFLASGTIALGDKKSDIVVTSPFLFVVLALTYIIETFSLARLTGRVSASDCPWR